MEEDYRKPCAKELNCACAELAGVLNRHSASADHRTRGRLLRGLPGAEPPKVHGGRARRPGERRELKESLSTNQPPRRGHVSDEEYRRQTESKVIKLDLPKR